MKPNKWQKLTKLGYQIISTQKYLGLSDEEVALIDMKIGLIEKLKRTRTAKGVTQQQLARLMRSSQSRVAAIERRAPDVTLDLIFKALFALGLSRKQLGRAITSSRAA